jgi:hypothetical protein
LVRTGATFADAAAEWLRYIEHDRGRRPSTVAGYKVMVRSMLLPAFGSLPLEAVTTPIIGRSTPVRGVYVGVGGAAERFGGSS